MSELKAIIDILETKPGPRAPKALRAIWDVAHTDEALEEAKLPDTLEGLHGIKGLFFLCDCPDTSDRDHFSVEGVGRTCEKGLASYICTECCTRNGRQTPTCLDEHEHSTDPRRRCQTIRAVYGLLED